MSTSAANAFNQAVNEGESIYFSAISLVELHYLIDKGRLPRIVLERLLEALNAPDTSLEVVPVTFDIALAIERILRADVPDMPDRIIAATALEMALPLVTRDRKIISSGLDIIW